jgi:uncharacterized protein YndB with AHSA1/START domain
MATLTRTVPIAFNAELDLQFERLVDLSPREIYEAWTTPALIVKWFTPAPWKTVKAKTDLRAGGRFHTVMQSPEGEPFPGEGCYLELLPNRRIVWTSAMSAGFRPRAQPKVGSAEFTFTAVLTLTPKGRRTRYHAHVMHADVQARTTHEAMGFAAGWNVALDQLVALMQKRRGRK